MFSPSGQENCARLKARKYLCKVSLAELQVRVMCAHICTEPDFEVHVNTCLDPLHKCPQAPLPWAPPQSLNTSATLVTICVSQGFL